jgi:hypothetical protein
MCNTQTHMSKFKVTIEDQSSTLSVEGYNNNFVSGQSCFTLSRDFEITLHKCLP